MGGKQERENAIFINLKNHKHIFKFVFLDPLKGFEFFPKEAFSIMDFCKKYDYCRI
jgi:hypothetical protein